MNREELTEKIKELELAPGIMGKIEEILKASDSVELTEEEKKQIGELLLLGAEVEDRLADVYEGFADGMERFSAAINDFVEETAEEEETEDVKRLEKRNKDLKKQLKDLGKEKSGGKKNG